MKRDMDLVRHILVRTEQADGELDAVDLVSGRWGFECVVYHVELLRAHGLIDADVTRDLSDYVVSCVVKALTWDGADYLDAIRDTSVWERTKRVVSESVGSTTLDVIKQAATMVAVNAIKAKLGLTI